MVIGGIQSYRLKGEREVMMRWLRFSRALLLKMLGVFGFLTFGFLSTAWAFKECPAHPSGPVAFETTITCLVENQKELYEAIKNGSAGNASSAVSASDLAFVPGKYTLEGYKADFVVKGPIKLVELGREMWTMRSSDGAFIVRWYTGNPDDTHPSFHAWDAKILSALQPGFSYGKSETHINLLNRWWAVGGAIGALQEGEDLTISYLGNDANVEQSYAFRLVKDDK